MAGQDLTESVVRLSNGVSIDNRIRLGSAVWLERKTGKSFMAWIDKLTDEDADMSFADIMLVLVALYLQLHQDETEADAEKALAGVDINEIGDVLSLALEFEPKNSPLSPMPEPATEAATEAASDQPE
jgi:hypothetical protein